MSDLRAGVALVSVLLSVLAGCGGDAPAASHPDGGATDAGGDAAVSPEDGLAISGCVNILI